MQCEWVKAVWFGSPMTIIFDVTDPRLSFTDWLATMINKGTKESVANIATLIYSIWRSRNLLVFQEKEIPVNCVVQQALASSFEYQNLGSTNQPPSNTSATGSRGNNIYWTPPSNGTLKLNV
jgi:hypothetical protein